VQTSEKAKQELYNNYIKFEKKHGNRKGIENLIKNQKLSEYESRIEKDKSDYDAYFDYAKLLIDDGDTAQVRDVYERGIAALPPGEKIISLFVIFIQRTAFSHYS